MMLYKECQNTELNLVLFYTLTIVYIFVESEEVVAVTKIANSIF